MPTLAMRRGLAAAKGAGLRIMGSSGRAAAAHWSSWRLAALLVVLAACEPDPTAIELAERSVVMHGVIVAGAERATIVLTEMSNEPAGRHAVPLSGATVHLSAGGDTTRLEQRGTAEPCTASPWISEEVLLDACYSAAVNGGIKAGTRYDLHVVLRDGRVIQGSTTVPRAATVLRPAPGTDIPRQPRNTMAPPPAFEVGWHHDAQPELAELRIAVGGTGCVVQLQGDAALLVAEDVTDRRDAVVRARLHCVEGAWADRLPAEVVLTVFDGNYASYVWHAKSSGAALHPEAASGITGAFGVFGSAAVARVPVNLVVQSPPPSAQ
jgi:hypothetical protein